jgi:hypothetical protein
MIAVIDNSEVIEKILRHLDLWSGPLPTLATARPPPTGECYYEPYEDADPMPDYENVLTD